MLFTLRLLSYLLRVFTNSWVVIFWGSIIPRFSAIISYSFPGKLHHFIIYLDRKKKCKNKFFILAGKFFYTRRNFFLYLQEIFFYTRKKISFIFFRKFFLYLWEKFFIFVEKIFYTRKKNFFVFVGKLFSLIIWVCVHWL